MTKTDSCFFWNARAEAEVGFRGYATQGKMPSVLAQTCSFLWTREKQSLQLHFGMSRFLLQRVYAPGRCNAQWAGRYNHSSPWAELQPAGVRAHPWCISFPQVWMTCCWLEKPKTETRTTMKRAWQGAEKGRRVMGREREGLGTISDCPGLWGSSKLWYIPLIWEMWRGSFAAQFPFYGDIVCACFDSQRKLKPRAGNLLPDHFA